MGNHEVFTINAETGILLTNMFFEARMQGYFDFTIMVNDSAGHKDEAAVSVRQAKMNTRIVRSDCSMVST